MKRHKHLFIGLGFLGAAIPVLFGTSAARAAEGRILISGPTSINVSGSYLLTQNITSGSGPAITINADNVTLDLGGHEITLTDASTYAIDTNGHDAITIRNGRITSTGGGIRLTKIKGVFAVERVFITMNGSNPNAKWGISVTGDCTQGRASVRLTDNIIRGVFGGNPTASYHGIGLGCVQGCIVANNQIHDTYYSIYMSDYATCIVSGNRLSQNAQGILALNGIGGLFFDNNVAASAQNAGLDIGFSSSPSNENYLLWNVVKNGAEGILIHGNRNALSWNSTTGLDTGIHISTGANNIYSHNRSLGNTTDFNIGTGNVDGGRNCNTNGCQ